MAYTTGSSILAADYNDFYNDVKDIYGDSNSNSQSDASLVFGYGETMLGSTVSAGDIITAAHWNNLIKMIHRCADHQGTSITLAGGANTDAVSVGDTIEPIANLASSITSIRTNKANVDAANQTTTQMDTGQYNNSCSAFATRKHAILQVITIYVISLTKVVQSSTHLVHQTVLVLHKMQNGQT